ncbi:hypothetical protein MRX96_030674 [Rhipicephalus microplus]
MSDYASATCVLELLSKVHIEKASALANRPWLDATPLLPEDHAVGLFWSSNQPFFGASRSAHFVPGRRAYQQASCLSVGPLNTGTSPAHSTHAWDLVKKQAQSNTPFSGSGSTLTMARANVPRFFLVQFLGLWSLQLLEPSSPPYPVPTICCQAMAGREASAARGSCGGTVLVLKSIFLRSIPVCALRARPSTVSTSIVPFSRPLEHQNFPCTFYACVGFG